MIFLKKKEKKEKFLETEQNYLNMAKLLFYIGKIKKGERERKKVIRMLVYTLDVRFTENQRNGNDATDQNISDRVDVLKKEILNTLFFHTIANDENDTYAAALQRQKESNNNQSEALRPHQVLAATKNKKEVLRRRNSPRNSLNRSRSPRNSPNRSPSSSPSSKRRGGRRRVKTRKRQKKTKTRKTIKKKYLK